ncbi:NACHT, LRR and PYD domains-containing protein 10 [Holothuria leucospilota]|uniref:NACHT, LRR and PYD domains-containing protein 10 n=1 Tax=Holothuria leucospilota TaxID=206669 RepID=A0A9Q1BXN7_HOLLE|nr:NACHT, LRR and PYD domains-containing protein 10 [Holothuria leucospilota]
MSFSEENGKILDEFSDPTGKHHLVFRIAANSYLAIVAVVWSHSLKEKGNQIVFYSITETKAFLVVDNHSMVDRISISDSGKVAVGELWTGDVKIFDISLIPTPQAALFTYELFKEHLVSTLQGDECVNLTDFFHLPKDQANAIVNSSTPTNTLLLALEEKGVVQPFNIAQSTLYGRFLAALSGHLTETSVSDLCDTFKIPDAENAIITSDQNPGLFLLIALDEMGVIKPSDVGALEQPLIRLELLQAVATLKEYQSILEEGNSQLQKDQHTIEGKHLVIEKRKLFIKCLQKKIKSYYETMTPVPWLKSCRWSSCDLFISVGLILTDSKDRRNLKDIDEQCRVQYKDIFCHDSLKSQTRIILEGDPGSGKTMLVSQLAYDWCQGKVMGVNIVILLPLKLMENNTLIKLISKFYVTEAMGLRPADIEDIIKDEGNGCCFLLDGLEELTGDRNNSEVMKVMTRAKYPSCRVVITSRSDYAQNLPACPMLKLIRFGAAERNAYIEKVFSDQSDKQAEVKQNIENNPFILDLCSIPMLFVLITHNIQSWARPPKENFDKVTPFLDSLVYSLCPSASSKKTSNSYPNTKTQQKISLEELAFNGLCRGFQQLSWQKDFVETTVLNSKQWLEEGVLVVDDSNGMVVSSSDHLYTGHMATSLGKPWENLKSKQTSKTGQSLPDDKEVGMAKSTIDYFKKISSFVQRKREEYSKLQHYDASPIEADSHLDEEEAEETASVAKYVPLRVKFLHKIIQEWFAAKYFSSLMSAYKTSDRIQAFLGERLPLIDPADLHYVLRFSLKFPAQPPALNKETLINLEMDSKTAWYRQTILEVAATITRTGGVVEIPYSGVRLDIPRNALVTGEDERIITMKIIPTSFSDTSPTNFGKNSSVTVELLPNDMKFQIPVRLELPHCLQLKKHTTYSAKIFMSHHEQGNKPIWEVKANQSYQLTDTSCKILLSTFCWVKYEIDDKIIEAKKIQIYSAGRKMSLCDQSCEPEIGYYPDVAGGGEILRLNKQLLVSSTKPFLFYKEGKEPLRVQFLEIVPKEWRYITPEDNPLEISFECVALSEERSLPFVFTKESEKPSIPVCVFRAQQGSRHVRMVHHPKYLSGEIASGWKFFGRNLGVSDGEIDHISKKFHDDLREGIYQMLRQWRQRGGQSASRAKLIEVLRAEKREDLATKVQFWDDRALVIMLSASRVTRVVKKESLPLMSAIGLTILKQPSDVKYHDLN